MLDVKKTFLVLSSVAIVKKATTTTKKCQKVYPLVGPAALSQLNPIHKERAIKF